MGNKTDREAIGFLEGLFLLLLFIISLFLAGCQATSNYIRTDYYDKQSNRTGYAIQEGNRIDYYNIKSERIGYSYIERD